MVLTYSWSYQGSDLPFLMERDDQEVDKGNLGGGCPNLPTKLTSLQQNFPTMKAFLAFQLQLALTVYCKFAEQLNIYCKFA